MDRNNRSWLSLSNTDYSKPPLSDLFLSLSFAKLLSWNVLVQLLTMTLESTSMLIDNFFTGPFLVFYFGRELRQQGRSSWFAADRLALW